MNIQTIYQKWLNSPNLSAAERQQLEKMSYDEQVDAFYKNIDFGTAGMRGLMGLGSNRINRLTIIKATIGYGLYLKKRFSDATQKGVVIAYDNRHQSQYFNDLIAATLSKMGFLVYIFDELRPTPQLSYTVRLKQAVGGIVITASHNPKQYNGFKIYDENGCQLTPLKIAPLIDEINNLADPIDVEVPLSATKGDIITLGEEVDLLYLHAVKSIQLHPELTKIGFKIVYSPQHGTGYKLGVRLLQECGYEIYQVEKQTYPDPNFSNTKTPNPEQKEAYEEAFILANKIDAHLVLITDPDADRVGVAYRVKKGEYTILNGNQAAALLIDYLLNERQKLGQLTRAGIVYDTIVTSPLGGKIAKYYGQMNESFLTGFKFIGDRIDFYEKTGGPKFEFGYEESYGCLIAPFARDKDGLQAILMYAEMALYHFLKNYTLGQILFILQKRHGFHLDEQISIYFEGMEGAKKMASLMARLRESPFTNIGSFKVVKFEDYLSRTLLDETGHYPIELPASDVVKFHLIDGSYIAVRPSGTEPKCKFYFSVIGTSEKNVTAKMKQIQMYFLATYNIQN